MKRPGPDLKMPDLKDVKVPAIVGDVFFDLRERRLLPLIALVVVATAAMPFLLGGGEEPVPPAAVVEPGIGDVGEAGEATLAVVEAKPGLRDYRKRLRDRSPTDPFAQRYTGLPESAKLKTVDVTPTGGSSGADEVEVTVTGGQDGIDEVEVKPAPADGDSGGGTGGKRGGSGGDDMDGMRFFGYRPDVRFGVAGSGELKFHKELSLGSLLPKRNPVLIFIGVSEDGKRAAFDLDPAIAWVRGDGNCVGGRGACRLLFLRAGEAVDLLTGTPGKVFRLKVTRIEFVELELPKKKDSEGASGSRAAASEPGWALGFSQNFSK